jgi:hypothetical protein
MGITAAASTVLYLLVLWDFAFRPFREAFGIGNFGGFYDEQARALMQGNIALPKDSLGIEAFMIDGKEYMYFPPGPSFLRIPILAVTDRFDGRLTAPSMLLAWSLTMVLLALIIWRVRHLLRGRAPLGRVEALGYGVLSASIGCGSVVLFLASMPFVYHEAYAWAITATLGAMYSLLGIIQRPGGRGLVSAGLWTLAAMMSRTTAGWACAGALALTLGWVLVDPSRRAATSTRWRAGLLAAALGPLAIGIGLNWHKFDHPYLFPLEKQEWTELSSHRREALAANGGDLVSIDIVPSTVNAYFQPDGIRFTRVFPFITLPAEPAEAIGGATLDQVYRTGSILPFMPLLTLLAAWGLIAAFRPRGAPGASLLRIPLLGVAAIPGAILCYGYIAMRYTSELIPLLALGSAVGLVDLSRRLVDRSSAHRRTVLVAMAALAAFGLMANLAVSFTTMRLANPGPPLQRYIRLQTEISDRTRRPQDDLLRIAPTLPREGAADRLQIVGDCDAAFVGTGDPLAPWTILDAREWAWTIDLPDEPGTEDVTIDLARAEGIDGDGLQLEFGDDGRMRAVYDDGNRVRRGRWRDIPDRDLLRMRLAFDLRRQHYVLIDEDAPERGFIDVNDSRPDEGDYFRRQVIMRPVAGTPVEVGGMVVAPVETPLPGRCVDLLERAEAAAS